MPAARPNPKRMVDAITDFILKAAAPSAAGVILCGVVWVSLRPETAGLLPGARIAAVYGLLRFVSGVV